jgi:hypothetical protein
MGKHAKHEALISERTYLKRAGLLAKKNIEIVEDPRKLMVHNHLEQNYFIGNKKALYYYMKKYYALTNQNLFEALPLTFHIVKGIEDPEYKNFLGQFNRFESLKKKHGS